MFDFAVVGVVCGVAGPGGELLVVDFFDPEGGEGNGFDAAAHGKVFHAGLQESGEVFGVATGTSEEDLAVDGGIVGAGEFDAEAADAAFEGEEAGTKFGEEVFGGEGDGFKLGGGAVEEALDGEGFVEADGGEGFGEASQGLVETAKEEIAEADEEAFARQGEEMLDAFDADLVQGGDEVGGEASAARGRGRRASDR